MQQRLASLLRTLRGGGGDRHTEAELEELQRVHGWTPLKPRGGNLFGRVPHGEGVRPSRIAHTQSKDLAVAGSGAPSPDARWLPEFCCGLLQRADLSSDAGRAKALAALSRREPIVLTGGAWELLPASRHWSVERLQEHLAGARQSCDVLRARREARKYTYYFKDLSDREMPPEALEAKPCNEALKMGVDQFLRLARDDAAHSYYLQMPLYAAHQTPDGRQQAYVPSASLKADLDKAVRRELWGEVVAAIQCGSWIRTQLFIGPVGTLGTAHFDQYDNMFLQVRGRKRILLFDPRTGHRGLYTFPVHHPFDMRARLDLEGPDKDTFPRSEELRGGGVEAFLRPGDALFIPSHWWHHVEAAPPPGGNRDGEGWCVSVNFWFDAVTPRLLEPSAPLSPLLEVELARQIEYLVADTFGAERVVPFLISCLEEVTAPSPAASLSPVGTTRSTQDCDPSDGDAWLAVRNFVLGELAAAVGPSQVRSFLEDYLDPGRWRSLPKGECF